MSKHLSAQPLIDFVERNMRRLDESRDPVTYRRVSKFLVRCRKTGRVGALAADDLLVGVFDIHPANVYGDEWWVSGPVETKYQQWANGETPAQWINENQQLERKRERERKVA